MPDFSLRQVYQAALDDDDTVIAKRQKDELLELAQEFVVEWSDLQSPDETEREIITYLLFISRLWQCSGHG